MGTEKVGLNGFPVDNDDAKCDILLVKATTQRVHLMPNMSYCRFYNTLQALRDCYEHMDEEDISPAEKNARDKLIVLCMEVAADYGADYDESLSGMIIAGVEAERCGAS